MIPCSPFSNLQRLKIVCHLFSTRNYCWCCVFFFQIMLQLVVPTLMGSGKPSLTARVVPLGSRGVMPTPCSTWCGWALCFSVNVTRYDWLLMSARFFYVINPLHPNIITHILHTVLYTFLKVETGRICLTIKSFLSWWSFSLFPWP